MENMAVDDNNNNNDDNGESRRMHLHISYVDSVGGVI